MSEGNEHRYEVHVPGGGLDIVIERSFTEDRLAALYDRFHPPKARDDFAFYLPLVMAADSVLDIGCGTGGLLRWAREEGHGGRLVGLDPAPGMLNQARVERDVDWVLSDLSSIHWEREFDLVVMTGHAFQELVEDEEIRTALRTIRAALAQGGVFAFETRNPLDRAWEHWDTDYSGTVVDAAGAVVRKVYRVELPVEGEIVRSVSTYRRPDWKQPEVSRGVLRFVSADALSLFLSQAEFLIDEQFGDWDRQPLSTMSPEIITLARTRDSEPNR